MHHVTWGTSAIDYAMCRYGQSRLLFRGPKKRFDSRYIAVIGGSRTFGKFVAAPYADLLEDSLGMRVVNLGSLNAGLDAFVADETLISIGLRAELVILELQGITDLSNRYYTVHPRRNDRFVQASLMMERQFPHADFSQFNFTRHMLKTLKKQWPDQFEPLLQDLRETWVSRVGRLLNLLPAKVVLLWMSDRPPPDKPLGIEASAPEGVDQKMIEAVLPHAVDFTEVIFGSDVLNLGTDGMQFLPFELEMASAFPGPMAHRQVADALHKQLVYHLN